MDGWPLNQAFKLAWSGEAKVTKAGTRTANSLNMVQRLAPGYVTSSTAPTPSSGVRVPVYSHGMRAIAVLFVGVAMSQVSFRSASLDEALRDAPAVVVAERAGAKWQVVEVMRWRGEAGKAPSGAITVVDAHHDFNEQVAKHIQEHGYQGVPSPIWPRYKSSLDYARFGKAKRAILFLAPWRSDWRYAIEGGWESVAKKDVVARAIARGDAK